MSLTHPGGRLSALEGLLVEPHDGGEAAAHAPRDVRQRVAHRPDHRRRRQLPVRVGAHLSRCLRVMVLCVVLGAAGGRGGNGGGGGRGAGGLVGGGGPLLGRLVGEGGGGQAQGNCQDLRKKCDKFSVLIFTTT